MTTSMAMTDAVMDGDELAAIALADQAEEQGCWEGAVYWRLVSYRLRGAFGIVEHRLGGWSLLIPTTLTEARLTVTTPNGMVYIWDEADGGDWTCEGIVLACQPEVRAMVLDILQAKSDLEEQAREIPTSHQMLSLLERSQSQRLSQ